MTIRNFLFALASASLLLGAVPQAEAARVNVKKIKKWPAEDRSWAIALDSWMNDEEMKVFSKLKTTDERKEFLVKSGHWQRWETLLEKHEDELVEAIVAQRVVPGMTQDEVYMAWDKPLKIRKDFIKEAYVEVLWYQFEIDRKGHEFLSWEESPTAYKNETFIKYVYMLDGEVWKVVEAGQEESIDDEAPVGGRPLTDSASSDEVDITQAPEESDAGPDFTLSEEDRKKAEKLKKKQEAEEKAIKDLDL